MLHLRVKDCKEQKTTVRLTPPHAEEKAIPPSSATHRGPHTPNLSPGSASRGASSQAAGARLAEARRQEERVSWRRPFKSGQPGEPPPPGPQRAAGHLGLAGSRIAAGPAG